MLSLIFGQHCKNFPSYFQQWILNYDNFLSFTQSTKRFKLWIYECCSSWTSQSFPIHRWDWNWEFQNISLDCNSKFFPCFHILPDWEDCLSDRVYVLGRGVDIHDVNVCGRLSDGNSFQAQMMGKFSNFLAVALLPPPQPLCCFWKKPHLLTNTSFCTDSTYAIIISQLR